MSELKYGHKMMRKKDIQVQIDREEQIIKDLTAKPYTVSTHLNEYYHRGLLEAYKNVLG